MVITIKTDEYEEDFTSISDDAVRCLLSEQGPGLDRLAA